jgi:hypothetical protein
MPGSSAPQRDVDSVASALADTLPALHRALDRLVARDYALPKPPEGRPSTRAPPCGRPPPRC